MSIHSAQEVNSLWKMSSIYCSCRKSCKGKEKEWHIKVYCVRIYQHYQQHITNGLFLQQKLILGVRNDCWVAVRVNSWQEHKTTAQTALAHFQNDNSLRKWVTMAESLQMRYTQAMSWHCQADSHLLWVITAESFPFTRERTRTHIYSTADARTDTHVYSMHMHRCTQTHRQSVWHQGHWIMTNECCCWIPHLGMLNRQPFNRNIVGILLILGGTKLEA